MVSFFVLFFSVRLRRPPASGTELFRSPAVGIRWRSGISRIRVSCALGAVEQQRYIHVLLSRPRTVGWTYHVWPTTHAACRRASIPNLLSTWPVALAACARSVQSRDRTHVNRALFLLYLALSARASWRQPLN
ncbi:hypothetical protein GGR56DRAFT_616232 [Xylariaceae sp. FL0804]|nr:hypothetical protein GGR56DRAFT_616232 [Xylariaceae sp. FL0804]